MHDEIGHIGVRPIRVGGIIHCAAAEGASTQTHDAVGIGSEASHRSHLPVGTYVSKPNNQEHLFSHLWMFADNAGFLYHILASCFPTKEVNITDLPSLVQKVTTCPACQIDASTNVHFQYTNGLPCAGRKAKHAFITGDFDTLEVGKNHIGEQPVLGRAKKMVQEV